MYGMLREFLFVDKQREALQNQLDALYSAANTTLDTNFNKWATIFALIALFLSLAGFFADGVDVVQKFKGYVWHVLALFGVAVAFSVGVISGFQIKYRRRH